MPQEETALQEPPEVHSDAELRLWTKDNVAFWGPSLMQGWPLPAPTEASQLIVPILVTAWESQQGSGGSPPGRPHMPTMSLCSHLANGLLDLVSNAKALSYPGMRVFCPQEATLKPSCLPCPAFLLPVEKQSIPAA